MRARPLALAAWLAALDRILEAPHGRVTHVRDEVRVDARHFVVQPEVPDFVEHIAIAAQPYEPDAEPHVEQDGDAVRIESERLRDVSRRDALFARPADGFENAEADERDTRLERNRRECELLRLGNGLQRAHARGPVVDDHRGLA